MRDQPRLPQGGETEVIIRTSLFREGLQSTQLKSTNHYGTHTCASGSGSEWSYGIERRPEAGEHRSLVHRTVIIVSLEEIRMSEGESVMGESRLTQSGIW